MLSATRGYRKLSSWQGFFSGAALFRDEHCLLSVHRSGFEERVKRLHFKDIKCIVVSKARRFGVSRRLIFGALLLLIALAFASRYSLLPAIVRLAFEIALVLVWLYLSIKESCRCRVYTAVSQEELLSIRRPWKARKLLAEMTPLIEAAQGTLPAGWKESLATDQPIEIGQTAAKPGQVSVPAERAESRSGRLAASVVLVACLLLDVVQTSWDLQRAEPMPNWIGSLLALLEAAAAVWVLIQNRGIDVSLQRLGAAVLIFLGLAYYGQTGITVVAQMQAQARTKRPLQAAEIRLTSAHRSYMEIYIGGCCVLAITCALLTLGDPTLRRQRVMVE
jgi:hypothetical protein